MNFLPIGSSQPQASTAIATNTDAQNGASETGSGANEQNEQFDTFLNLLTAQIRNQDPLAPLDSTQFVEQLATFSNLELQAKNNQLLEGITSLLRQQIAGAPVQPPATDPT